MNIRQRVGATLVTVVALLNGCAHRSTAGGTATGAAPAVTRNEIVPLVDHHQHLISAGTMEMITSPPGSRVRGISFDLTDVAATARQAGVDADAVMTRMVDLMRKIGLDRMHYGSDPAVFGRPAPREAWALFREVMPLTDEEVAIIANNVAPYMELPRR